MPILVKMAIPILCLLYYFYIQYMLDKVILSEVVFRLKQRFANKQVLILKAKSSEKVLAKPIKTN